MDRTRNPDHIDLDVKFIIMVSLVSLVVYGAALVLMQCTPALLAIPILGRCILVLAGFAFLVVGVSANTLLWQFIFQVFCKSDPDTCPWGCFSVASFVLGTYVLAAASPSNIPERERYWELQSLGLLKNVEICDTQWRDFHGGIYFSDGTLAQHGLIPQAVQINVSDCVTVEHHGRSESLDPHAQDCWFMALPIFPCDAGATCEPRACAWAVTAGVGKPPPPAEAPSCGSSSSGLCGFLASDLKVILPELSKEEEAARKVHEALRAAAPKFPGPGNLSADRPLLSLENPEQAITSLEKATTRGLFKKYLLLLIYMPLPVLLALLAAARTEMCVDAVGEVADLLEEWSEGEDRD